MSQQELWGNNGVEAAPSEAQQARDIEEEARGDDLEQISPERLMAVRLSLQEDEDEAENEKEKSRGAKPNPTMARIPIGSVLPAVGPPAQSLPGAFAQSPDGNALVHAPTEDPSVSQVSDTSSTGNGNRLAVAAEVAPSVLELENQIKQQRQVIEDLSLRNSGFESTEISVLSDAPFAQVVENNEARRNKKWTGVGLCLFVLLTVIMVPVAIGLTNRNGDTDKDDITTNHAPRDVHTNQHKTTLEAVKSRGIVRCAVTKDAMPGISFFDNETNTWSGLNIDLCRVIAAAALGNASKIEPVLIPFAEWPFVLKNKTVDVLTALIFDYMSREVWEPQSETSFSFVPPFAHVGIQFAGLPEFVDCADRLDSYHGPCRKLSICMQASSTHEKNVATKLPGAVIVPQDSDQASRWPDFLSGKCNVMAHSTYFSQTDEQYLRDLNYTGPYKIGSRIFSRQAFSFPTLANDTEWSSLVRLASSALFTAEVYNITQATVEKGLLLLPALDNHKEFRDLLIDIISAVGNTGAFLGKPPQKPRSGLNRLVTDEDQTGLILSLPFGDVENQGMYWSGGVIDTILQRGFVRCGVAKRSDFAGTNGSVSARLDMEYCLALAAALFSHSAQQSVQYVEITNSSERFSSLSRGDIDVLAGEPVNLLNTWREPSTGKGYTFSIPYFYGSYMGDHSYALATRQDDSQWSAFVNWVIMSTFYAEENAIDQNRSVEMPVVRLFGEQLKQMFRDCIFEVGNYGEMYNRTLEATIPRSGRNNLNAGGPMQFAYPFV